jgi:curved DNA-binding protein CbpA
MPRPLDPWRTLELPRDATLDEVKAAYRRLAKRYHPDSAGETALTRFLAVQAAYEALTEGPARLRLGLGGRTPRPAAAHQSRPSDAGPAGPRAAHAGGRTRTGRAGGGTGRRGANRKRAKPGSTSYDDAQFEPFEPSWEGASWYGDSSGTYWTLNPKEFADPRKHGPEYQARARSAGIRRGRGHDEAGPSAEPDPDQEASTGEADARASGPWQGRTQPRTDGRGMPPSAAGEDSPSSAGWMPPGQPQPGDRSQPRAATRVGTTSSPSGLAADTVMASTPAADLVALGLLALGVATLALVFLGGPLIAGLESTVAAGGLASIVVAVILRGLASRHSPG